MKIGLTGSIACGKTTVCDHLRALGYAVIDADAISRSLTAPNGAALPAIRQAFGSDVFLADGTLDRRALGRLVFEYSEQRDKLNQILHPIILETIAREMDKRDHADTLVFGDIPLLYECHMAHTFDQVWVVAVQEKTQLVRLMERDHLSRKDALSRIHSQMPIEEKIRLADAVICSEGSIEETQKQVDALVLKLRRS